jgi:hypothetical protein
MIEIAPPGSGERARLHFAWAERHANIAEIFSCRNYGTLKWVGDAGPHGFVPKCMGL